MKLRTRKLLSLFLIIAVICSVLSISVFSSDAKVDELASTGAIETYNLKVGDTKYIFLNEADKAVQSAVWKSNAPFDVEIISQDSVSCQVKVNNYISTTAIITCEYYYQQFNSLTGQIWLLKGAKSFYVKVSDTAGTETPIPPIKPVVPDKPQGPFIMNEFTAGVYTYNIKPDGTAEIIDYDAKLENIIRIPKWMDDYTTTSIGSFAFEYCKSLTKITFPEKVTFIGSKAFYDCEKLQTVVLPQGLSEIGAGAFMYCLKLDNVILPQGITVIKSETFSICTSLKNITIPEGVTKIEKEAFASCTALEKVIIPESIESIDATAFDECNKEKLIIYGYEGTVAESFANEYGYNFVRIKKLADADSGIWVGVISENETKLSVNEITDVSSVDEVNLALENEIAINIYDVSIKNAEENEVVAVKIATDNEAVKVYRIESDGKLTKIDTRFCESGIVFNTNVLGSFVLAVDGSLVIPDETTVATEPSDFTQSTENTTLVSVSTEPTEVTTTTSDSVSTESAEVTTSTFSASTESAEVTTITSSVITEPTEISTTTLQTENTTEIPAESVTSTTNSPLGTDLSEPTETNPTESESTSVLSTENTVLDSEYALGDVNTDGKFNIKDATTIQKYIAKMVDFDEVQQFLADYNGDEKINIKDATMIQKKLAKLI